MNSLPLMVIDDDPYAAEVIRHLLLSVNLESVVVTSTEAAFAALENEHQPVSGFVVDVSLPKMNGLQFAKAVRESHHHCTLPVIGISAFDQPGLRASAIEHGMNEFFPKAPDMQPFIVAVKSIFRQAPAQ